MAQLSATESTRRLPVGDRSQRTFQLTTGGVSQTDEWIETGLSVIDAVVGHGVSGSATAVVFKKNAQGTGAAEGSSRGSLGVLSSNAATTLEVTVLGRP